MEQITNLAKNKETPVASSLKLTEQNFRDLVHSSPDAIFVYVDDKIIFANNTAVKLLNAEKPEYVLGRDMLDFIPASNRKALKNAVDLIINNKKSYISTEEKLMTIDGKTIDIEISTTSFDFNGKKGVQAFIRDISKRKQLEKEIILISERIRHQVSRDLHDDLNPHLIGIEALTQVLSMNLKKMNIPESADSEKISALINKAITKTHRLARGLCPVDMQSSGIQTPLMSLIKLVRNLYKIECKFTYDESIIIEDITLATNLYYIAQEATLNAAKYSGGTLISITLEINSDMMTLSIEDNGSGLVRKKEPDGGRNSGMGLKIMKYRAEIIDGIFSIRKNRPTGTAIVVKIPTNILKTQGRISYGGRIPKIKPETSDLYS